MLVDAQSNHIVIGERFDATPRAARRDHRCQWRCVVGRPILDHNRTGRLITSMHVDLTDLAEQIVTQLSQRS
jgi:hypothetical protein